MRDFGEKVLLARTKRRLSQDALARQIGKSHGWLSLLERGLIEQPRLEDIYAIAQALELDPKEMAQLAGVTETSVAAGPVGRRITLSETELEALLERAVTRGVESALAEIGQRPPKKGS
jgi:transcriptional regulator with XRE-family HTH domain